jgi:hypothetical protein
MTTDTKLGYGTTLTWNSQTVAELTNIGVPEITTEMLDGTSFDSSDTFREKIAGMLESGPMPVKGWFYPGDTNGQYAMIADQLSRTSRTFVITLPTAMATTFTGTGYVSKFKVGDIAPDGRIEVDFEITPTGKVTFATTASDGLTTPFFTVTGTGGASTITPAAAQASLEYNVTLAAGSTSYYITPTATSGTITITDNSGNTQTVLTGANSTSITAPTNSMHTVYIDVKETNKTAKRYTLHIGEPV